MDTLSIKNMLLCSKHTNRAASFIQIAQIDEEEKQVFYCDICIMSNKTKKLSNFIHIQDIMGASETTFIDYWPPLEDENMHQEIAKLRVIQEETLQSRICQFFDEMKNKINAKIDEVKKTLLKDSFIQELPSKFAENMNKLTEIQKLKEFQNIFKDEITTSVQKEQQYTEFINTFLSEKKQNTMQIRDILSQIQYEKQLFDLEKPLQIQKELLQQIEKITFYKNEIDLMPYLDFYPSKCNQTQSAGITLSKFIHTGIQINSPSKLYFGSFYSNFILNPDLKYVFTIKYERQSKESESFSVGLLLDNNKDKYQSYTEKLNCSYFFNQIYFGHCPGAGIDKVVSDSINSNMPSIQPHHPNYSSNTLTFKVCIKDQLLEVYDRDKRVKYQIDDQYKMMMTPENTFRFSIYVQYQIKVYLMSAKIVRSFDDNNNEGQMQVQQFGQPPSAIRRDYQYGENSNY